MSWIEKINNIKLKITTGDGLVYEPLWVEASKIVPYNTQTFNFVNIEGAYIERFKKGANSYPFTILFQGEDCIEKAEAFEISARNSNAWFITHPFYGEIIVQPQTLEFDNTAYNVSRITGTLIETILIKYPQEVASLEKEIQAQKAIIDDMVVTVFNSDVKNVLNGEISANSQFIACSQKNYSNIALKSDLTDLVRIVSGTLNNIASDANSYILALKNLINYPFLISQTIQQKTTSIIDNFTELGNTFVKADMTENEQRFYSLYGALLLSQSAENVTKTGKTEDYTRGQITYMISQITNAYQIYKDNIDNFTIYLNFDLMFNLDNVILKALINLQQRILSAKQEFQLILNEDDNIINLCYKYYQTTDDATLLNFIKYNNISLDEFIQLNKGRIIRYLA